MAAREVAKARRELVGCSRGNPVFWRGSSFLLFVLLSVMGGKKSNKQSGFKWCSCGKWEWNSLAGPGQHCRFCGAPWSGNSGSPEGGKKAGGEPGGARPKVAAGFKYATQEVVDGVEERHHKFLRLMEVEKTKEAVLAFAEDIPALKGAADAIVDPVDAAAAKASVGSVVAASTDSLVMEVVAATV